MLLRQRSEVATLKAELEAYAGRVQTGDGGSTAASAAPGPSGALRFADAPTSDKPGSGGKKGGVCCTKPLCATAGAAAL